MLLSTLQYLGILLALGDSLVQAVQGGDFESSTEDLVDSNYDLPDPPEQQNNENNQKVTFDFVTKLSLILKNMIISIIMIKIITLKIIYITLKERI